MKWFPLYVLIVVLHDVMFCLPWHLQGQPIYNKSSTTRVRGTSLVIVIPAYNEEHRLPPTLRSYISYLEESRLSCQIEILVVDDGSNDRTKSAISTQLSEGIPIRCISLSHNQGKGAALARGVQDVKRRYCIDSDGNFLTDRNVLILTLDADGSGELRYIQTMLESLQALLEDYPDHYLEEGMFALVIGNRNYDIFSLRGILRGGFQLSVWLLTGGILRVQDSQCGYKLMTLPTADLLYQDLNLKGWSHDVEVLYRATRYEIPICEVPMDWKDKDGSKVIENGVVNVSLQMLFDVIRLRWSYMRGDWELPQPKNRHKSLEN